PRSPCRRRHRSGAAAMSDTRTCIVAEDETLLRHALVAELGRAWPALQVVAECEDGASAVEALAEHTPDVAFLDIRMPGLTGLEVAALAAEASPRTKIVFVTAYDQYAIDAFERGAIDYLLKPVKPERLDATVARLQAQDNSQDAASLAALLDKLGALPNAAGPGTKVGLVTGDEQYAIDAFERGAIDYLLKPVKPERLDATVARLQAQDNSQDAASLAALLDKLGALPNAAGAAEPLTWLTASAGRETRLVLVDDVAYFRADHKYTTVVTAEGEALLRTPLRELLPRLDPAHFKQIHRSTIVNLKAIA